MAKFWYWVMRLFMLLLIISSSFIFLVELVAGVHWFDCMRNLGNLFGLIAWRVIFIKDCENVISN